MFVHKIHFWKNWTRVYLGKFLLCLQKVLDFCLHLSFGFTTRFGWKKDFIEAQEKYEKSAQLVR